MLARPKRQRNCGERIPRMPRDTFTRDVWCGIKNRNRTVGDLMERDFQESLHGVDTGATRIPRWPTYIHYNPRRDLPLLLAIRNATVICHRQLWNLHSARGVGTCRRSFNWRIRLLTDVGIVQKLLR